MKSKIIIFTKYPKLGFVKTRLGKSVGDAEACRLHKIMSEFCMSQALRVSVDVEIRYTGATRDEVGLWLGGMCSYREQVGETLGERMANAFNDSFAEGYEKVVLVGTDIPSMRASHLIDALIGLDDSDCVLGKSADGGYYLIALSQMIDVFSDITWSSSSVFDETVKRLKGYKYSTVETLKDVDEVADIPLKISVIIPALNEASMIGDTLDDVLSAFDVEVIVVDGGSCDETCNIARSRGATVYTGATGRAAQMNLGAEYASGDILLFLHADSMLPMDWDVEVRKVFSSNAVAGYFKFKVMDKFRGSWLVERLTNWRADKRKLPYGDQAIFVSRREFEAVGGYRDVPIMEDVYFMQEIVKHGDVKGLGVAVGTSGRRWLSKGLVRTFLYNQLVLFLASRGYPLERLRKFYRGEIGLLRLMLR